MRSSEYTNKHGYLNRYFTRWVTEQTDNGYLRVTKWELCDRKKFDNIGLSKFETKDEADAMCRLMNSIEEENDGLSK